MIRMLEKPPTLAARLMAGYGLDRSRGDISSSVRTFSMAKDQIAPLETGHDELVFIAEGSMKLVAHASDSRDQIVAFQFAGDLVCVPARASHSYTLVALTPCRLEAIAYDRMVGIAHGDAEILGKLLAATRTSLARCREKSIALGRKTAPERLAGFLVSLADRIGRDCDRGVTLDLPMSRRDIADSLGLTIETVSRQFSLLRDEGIIETTGRSGVTLRDKPLLTSRAGYLPGAT